MSTKQKIMHYTLWYKYALQKLLWKIQTYLKLLNIAVIHHTLEKRKRKRMARYCINKYSNFKIAKFQSGSICKMQKKRKDCSKNKLFTLNKTTRIKNKWYKITLQFVFI